MIFSYIWHIFIRIIASDPHFYSYMNALLEV
jgi:hypothetical protein